MNVGVGTDRRDAAVAVLGGAALLGAIAVVYAPILRNGWVWDDWTNVVALRERWSLSREGIRWAFTNTAMGHYQPLTWLSYALDRALWGDGPAPVHALNFVLHALNALLVGVLCAGLGEAARGKSPTGAWRRRPLMALLSAAFFALHPLRVESVAWATERRDLLSAFFGLLMSHFHVSAAAVVGATALRLRVWTFVAFLLTLLSKAQITLPLGLLVLDFFPLRRASSTDGRVDGARLRSLFVEKLPLFGLSGLFSVVALFAQSRSGALTSMQEAGLLARAAQAAYGIVFYPRATLFGRRFSPLYERPVPLNPTETRFVLAALCAAALIAMAVLWRRRAPAFTAAFVWQVVLLAPVLGLSQAGVQLVADRYSYLSCLGWTLLLALGVEALLAPRRAAAIRAAAAAGTLGMLATWSALSRSQTLVWSDDETLWRHVLGEGPSALAASNLGSIVAARGEVEEGAGLFLLSLETVPSYDRPWYGLRALFEREPAVPAALARRAVPALRRAINHQATSAGARYTLGLALARAGDTVAARDAFDEALRLRPGYEPALRERRRLP